MKLNEMKRAALDNVESGKQAANFSVVFFFFEKEKTASVEELLLFSSALYTTYNNVGHANGL